MIEDWIDLIAFRKFLTKGQKWFLVIFYLIIGGILLVGNVVLIGVKLFAWFFGLLADGNRK